MTVKEVCALVGVPADKSHGHQVGVAMKVKIEESEFDIVKLASL